MLLLPEPPAEVRDPLLNVLERATSQGSPEPPWIAVDDGSGEWVVQAAARPPQERAQSVLAAASEEALVIGHRLGIGGAVWLPPSTPSTAASLERAGSSEALVNLAVDQGLHISGLAAGQDLAVVTWVNRHFWLCQLGDRALAGLLVEVARALVAVPAIISWPALLVAGYSTQEIRRSWEMVSEGRAEVPVQGLEIVQIPWPAEGLAGVLPQAAKALMATEKVHCRPESDRSCPPRPVCALPSGRLLGHWSPIDCESTAGKGWSALPEISDAGGYRWRLRSQDGGEHLVDEVVDCEAVLRCEGLAVRVPGWLTGGIRGGSPAGLLIERLAGAARRAQVSLWVSNVDQEALRFLLRLNSPLWVDGPAVPEPSS